MSNASCSRCPREPVQVLDGHFSNGRRVEDPRCERHSELPDGVGNKVLRGTSSSTFQIDAIRPLDASRETVRPPAVTNIVQRDGIHVLDAERRTYMALSRDGSYWHVVYPAQPWEWVVQQGKRPEGALICTCEGGRMHGYCYRVDQAEALEQRLEDDARWAVAS